MKKETWELEDVEKIVKLYPYTYYQPSLALLKTLKVGELVKLTFVYAEDVASERMWVKIKEIKDDFSFIGNLRNQLSSSDVLLVDDEISFEAKHISDIYEKFEESIVDEYHDRCITIVRILDGEDSIGFIYFEEPHTLENVDDYISTGITILSGNETDEYVNNVDNLRFVSLGAVLNLDDSFIDLLTLENIGKSFERNSDGVFSLGNYTKGRVS